MPFRSDGSVLGRVIGSDTLMLVCIVLIIVVAATIVALVLARKEARFHRQQAMQQAARSDELVRTVRLTESIAGLGIWQYEPATGEQEWSNGLRRLFGVPDDEPLMEGDVETLLFANGIDLTGAVTERLGAEDTYKLHFDIYGFDGCPRSLSVEACNLHDDAGGPVRVVAVVHDVTDQVEKERELEASRNEAMREANVARRLADTDALTGLANRRSLMKQLDALIVDARRNASQLALIIFDIDRFKSVNDTYGHIAGDKVLQTVARIASSQGREGDVVARVGGEEFVWVVPGAGEMSARSMSERLRQCIGTESATDGVPPVTISAGIAELLSGDTSLSLFARADGALYQAKDAGRNQVRLAA